MSSRETTQRMVLVLDPWLEAARILEDERRLHPTFADQRHLLGLLYLAREEPAPALEEFEAALAVNPGYARARFSRLVALRQRDGSLDPAIWNREGPAASADEPERSLWTAWFLGQQGDRNGVRAVLQRLSETVPWTPLAFYALALHQHSWGDVAAATDSLRVSATAHPLFRRILEGRRLLPAAHHGPRDGRGPRRWPEQEAQDASAWNPCGSDLYEYLGNLCARHGRPDEALPYYEEAFLRQGKESLHLVRLAQLALARGEEEDAVRALCRAIEVDPTSAPARISLGYEYQSQGFHDEALIQFEVAARLRPSYPDVQYNLGLLYRAQGRAADAIRCLRAALDINPGYFQARTTLAQILLQREDWDSAFRELGVLSEQGVRSADLQVQKAQALLALGSAEDAVRELEAAVAINPSYARTYYILGQVYRQLGLRRKARSAWQQYLDHSRTWRDQKAGEEEESFR